jgi:hypothetical protein
MFKILLLAMLLHGHQPVPGAFHLGLYGSMAECEGERLSQNALPVIRQMFKTLDVTGDMSFKIVKTACVPTESDA